MIPPLNDFLQAAGRAPTTALAAAALAALAIFLVWSRHVVPAEVTARRALDPSDTMSVSRDRWIAFRPRGEQPATGIVFYPGGKADPLAYAPVLSRLADSGYLVVLVPMPFNLAMLAPSRADDVRARYPDVKHWFIAGHSFGGTIAARYAQGHAESLAGLILWASFPESSVDLRLARLAVLSIYGSGDELTTPAQALAARPRLPAAAKFVAVAGAGHWSFGNFSVPGQDARERRREQDAVLDATREFIRLAAVDSMPGTTDVTTD